MKANSTASVRVESAGDQVVAHGGLHALGGLADRLGLGDSLSTWIAGTGERGVVHDRGKVLVQAMLMLAGGGESCADIEHLRSQGDLFGDVASDSTLYRALRRIDPVTLRGLWGAMAETRARVWRRSAATPQASLVEIHSENKQRTAANYKHDFGFHPMLCFVTPPAKRSPRSCVLATPRPTVSPIISPCSTPPWLSCPPASLWAIGSAMTEPPSGGGDGTNRFSRRQSRLCSGLSGTQRRICRRSPQNLQHPTAICPRSKTTRPGG